MDGDKSNFAQLYSKPLGDERTENYVTGLQVFSSGL